MLALQRLMGYAHAPSESRTKNDSMLALLLQFKTGHIRSGGLAAERRMEECECAGAPTASRKSWVTRDKAVRTPQPAPAMVPDTGGMLPSAFGCGVLRIFRDKARVRMPSQVASRTRATASPRPQRNHRDCRMNQLQAAQHSQRSWHPADPLGHGHFASPPSSPQGVQCSQPHRSQDYFGSKRAEGHPFTTRDAPC